MDTRARDLSDVVDVLDAEKYVSNLGLTAAHFSKINNTASIACNLWLSSKNNDILNVARRSYLLFRQQNRNISMELINRSLLNPNRHRKI